MLNFIRNRMGWTRTLTFLQYGKHFHKQRKLLQQYFSRQKCPEFHAIQVHEALILVKSLIEKPEDFEWLIRRLVTPLLWLPRIIYLFTFFGDRFATAIVIKLAYGHQITSDKDEYIQIAEDSTRALHAGGVLGATPLDFFPFC